MATNRRRSRRARRDRARRTPEAVAVVIHDVADLERLIADEMEGGPRVAFATATEQIWLKIIAERPDLRDAVVWNKTTTAPVLAVLAQDPDQSIRHFIARTRRISPEVFHILAQDPSEDVRATLVDHPKLPDEIKKILLRDTSPWVRRAIAQRRWGSGPVDE